MNTLTKTFWLYRKLRNASCWISAIPCCPSVVLHSKVSTRKAIQIKMMHLIPPTAAPAILLMPLITGSFVRTFRINPSSLITATESTKEIYKDIPFSAITASESEIYSVNVLTAR